jgi:hypothetical protein
VIDYTKIVGRAVTHLGAVILVMFLVVGAMVFFSHTLFTQALPSNMAEWEKTMAAWLMAFGWEFTVLITTCNVKHLHPRIPAIMAACSGVIMLYFVQEFDLDQSLLVISQRWFVALLIASVNYIYADLFYKKWLEFIQSIDLATQVNQLQSQLNEVQSRVNEGHSALNEVRSLRIQINKYKVQLTCPHCATEFTEYGSLHAHKGHCAKNPRHKSQ